MKGDQLEAKGEGSPGGAADPGQQIPSRLQGQPLHGAARHQADQGTHQESGRAAGVPISCHRGAPRGQRC